MDVHSKALGIIVSTLPDIHDMSASICIVWIAAYSCNYLVKFEIYCNAVYLCIDWKPVIGIAAVSCSGSNGGLCRRFIGHGYPTIRV